MDAAPARTNLIGLLPHEVVPLLPEAHPEPYRAEQILNWIYRRGCTDFSAMTNLPKRFREAAARRFSLGDLHPENRTVSANEDATKYLWRLHDGAAIESVHLVLPSKETFCISSQVGCAYGCTFCATARMGFRRHLTEQEIFEQVFRLREDLRVKYDGQVPAYNVVFMGMGEPLANYDNVVGAIRRITAIEGLNLGERRVTVSTVGLAGQIRQLAVEGMKVGLAVSLNATTDELRQTTMPVTKKHGITEVIDAAREYAHASGRRVTLEYVLLKDVNDTMEDGDRLREIARSLPSKINIIPFNPFPGADHERPDEPWITRFLEHLMRGQAPAVTCRTTRGLDIAAACGQLAVAS